MKLSSTALGADQAGFLEQLCEQYRAQPDSVDRSWRCVFEFLDEFEHSTAISGDIEAAERLRELFRSGGHLLANLNPINSAVPADTTVLASSLLLKTGDAGAGNQELIEQLRRLYCGTLAVESAHVDDSRIREWIAQSVERAREPDPEDLWTAMRTLVAAEEFERIMGLRFPGKKRFGSEGADVLLPTLERLLIDASVAGITDVVIGTMHRGRLNTLGTVLGRPLEQLFAEFKGKYPFADDRTAAADVPYHLGYDTQLTVRGRPLRVTLCPNPSHLEAVNAIALGRARARRDAGVERRVLCVVLHTDASVIAQGVVAEAVQMSRLAGFESGGSVHIVVNNQIGFTTEPDEARTSRYCTGAWKAIDSLILHVNGDYPESALRAADLAIEFREAHHRDCVIDLICYRRNGHNEVDEPRFTQPKLYTAIAAHATVANLFGGRLIAQELRTLASIDALRVEARAKLDGGFDAIGEVADKMSVAGASVPSAALVAPPSTGVPIDDLRMLLESISKVPADLSLDAKLVRLVAQRRNSVDIGASWPVGEALAFASLLTEGTPIRLSGQDVVRGAFSHRHYALTDVETGRRHVTLNHLSERQARFDVVNSPLSEYAVLGFEYGYSVERPEALVIWEAQFGDFANAAQVVIDQFVTSGAEKWRQHSGLVIYLPHGLEGQGPEHSSARLERLLMLCARDNIEVAQPSTPANYFHLLRRQVGRTPPRPLFIIGAKSLLRLPAAVSPLAAFGPGTRFEPVVTSAETSAVRHVLLCSGKIAYELERERVRTGIDNCAIVRIEMLYPFPNDALVRLLGSWHDAGIAWVQEEPANQGAWSHVRDSVERLLGDVKRSTLRCFSRPESSSPAGSFHGDHERDQARLVTQAIEWASSKADRKARERQR